MKKFSSDLELNRTINDANRSVFMCCSVGLQMANSLVSVLELSLFSHRAQIRSFLINHFSQA
jgi:hypothetical protein